MLTTLSSVVERLRRSVVAIPAALVLAAVMLAVNELAYRGAHGLLRELVGMGQSRVLLLDSVQRMAEAESAKRGFLLTDGPEYLRPYELARRQVPADLADLRKAYTQLQDHEALALLTELESIQLAKLSEMDEVLRLHRAGRPEAALDVVRSGIGRELMARLHDVSAQLLAQQNRRIATGLGEVFDTLLLNRVGIGTTTVVALLAIIMFVRLGRQLESQRAERQAEIEAERQRLELEVARRTAELTELARHLQTAREDERARLARDLHDELGALLTAAKLDVARIKPRLQQSAPELMERLGHLTASLNSGIALKRRIIEDLRPSTLTSLGVVASLEILCTEFSERSGLKVSCDLQRVQLSPTGDLCLYRLAQESLTNIAKYAQATQVKVTLHDHGDEAVFTITDDGVGFEPGHVRSGAHGLVGMRFRVEAENGRLQVQSQPGSGTTVRASLPQHPREAGTAQAAAA
jgi:signal transduction histidine kinase